MERPFWDDRIYRSGQVGKEDNLTDLQGCAKFQSDVLSK